MDQKNDRIDFGIDITEILLSIFEETDVVKSKHIEKIKGSNKTNKVYIFNHKLDNSSSFSDLYIRQMKYTRISI